MNKPAAKTFMITITSWLFMAISPVSTPLQAAELIMLEQEYCSWCERWNDEIGGIYHKTSEGKTAPLRRFDIHEPMPKEFANLEKVLFTPTFVLWDNGQEISRLRGYPGDEFFWFLLGEMLEKLPKSGK